MKKIYTLLVLASLTIISCSKDSEEAVVQKDDSTTVEQSRLFNPSDDGPMFCTSVDLIAGQNYDAGNVEVSIDGDLLLITYTTEGDWVLDATHLYAGDCEERPANNPGNPLIGHFPMAETHPSGTTSYTYSIDMSTLGNCICIAAHAEVSGSNGSETAWADGLPYGGNSWAMYFEYCLDQCTPN